MTDTFHQKAYETFMALNALKDQVEKTHGFLLNSVHFTVKFWNDSPKEKVYPAYEKGMKEITSLYNELLLAHHELLNSLNTEVYSSPASQTEDAAAISHSREKDE